MSKPSQQWMATEGTAFLFDEVLTAEFANLETHVPLVFGKSCTSGLCWSMGTSNSTHTVWCQAIPYSHSPIFAGSNIHASICRISYLFTPCLTHMNYRSLVNVLRMMLRCVFTHNSLCSTQDQTNQDNSMTSMPSNLAKINTFEDKRPGWWTPQHESLATRKISSTEM
jgi:hypothetical protein